MSYQFKSPAHRIQISIWLGIICLLVATTVLVGGVTRLTNSGLSITEWKPLIGAIPPLNESTWHDLFEKYKKIPEYSIEHPDMTLQGFKFIFFWEWAHRNLGRFIGLIFFIPFLIFSYQKKMPSNLKRKLLFGFALGGLQGVLGWLMVKSGLVNRVDVSHYRLAAHLILAFFIFSFFLRLIFDINVSKSSIETSHQFKRLRIHLIILHSLVGLQIIYGAFVAGLRAGYMFNTFPKMNGQWLPIESFVHSPWYLTFVENPITVQFIHRSLAALVLFGALLLIPSVLNRRLNSLFKFTLAIFTLAVFIQFLLGVLTLVLKMPIAIASAHQIGGLVVFALMTFTTYLVRTPIFSDSSKALPSI